MAVFAVLKTKAQEILTLQQAVEIATQTNVQMRIAQNAVLLAQSNDTRGNAGQLPTVNLSALRDNSISNVKQEFISGTSNNRKGAKNNTLQMGVEAAWTIWDGKRMFIARERLHETVRNQQIISQIQKQQITYQVHRSYLLLVQQKQLYKLYAQAVE